MPYAVEFAQSVEDHFRALTARDRRIVLAAINRRLLDEPLTEARHRKPLRPNPIAPWELRVGEFRVFYEVVGGRERRGPSPRKRRNVLIIGGKEIQL